MSDSELPFQHPWDEGLLKNYASVIVGGTPSTGVEEFWDGVIPWMTSGEVHLQHIYDVPGRITQKGLQSSNAVLVQPKAVAVALAGQGKTRGTVALTHVPICTNQSVALIKLIDSRLDTDFLYQSLIPRYEELRSRSAGGGRAGLSKTILENIPVQVPPLPRQKRIVQVLQTIDRAIAHTEALIEKYQKIKAGLMHDLFTRGIGADGKLRPPREQAPELYQETAIGWIPKEWNIKLCQEIFSIDSGITLGAHRRPKKNPRPYLRVANVFKEKIVIDDINYLEASEQENVKYSLHSEDLLLVEGHANVQQIGRCGMVKNNAEGMLFQNHLFRLKAIDLSAYFGMYLLNSSVARRYWEMNCSTSSGLNTINRKMLGNMVLGIPLKKEQSNIERELYSVSKYIEREENSMKKLMAQKFGLMHDLLTGKVPVKVEPDEVEHD
ncbi:MAG: restriction endonuclease subunit S [Cyanobacteria bacterium P01_G01_bin.54]